MDPNITPIVNNHQENQLLLNAIKNKFDSRTASEPEDFSPPKFNIPILKISEKTTLENVNHNYKTINTQTTHSATQLNQFLFKKLQEKHANNDLFKNPTGFVLPQLQTSADNKLVMKFELPSLKAQPANANISNLTTAIDKLQIQDNKCDAEKHSLPLRTAAIDLTTALATELQTHQGTPPTRDFIKPSQTNDKFDFEIPFIDCDRLDVSRKHRIHLPTSNEYCVADISKLLPQHALAVPSAIGRFLCIDDNKYLAPLPLKCLMPEYRLQKVKHNIEPFRFETKSPDDLVLSALNKYQKRHYN